MCAKEKKPVCKGKETYKNFCDAFCHGCKADDLHECDTDNEYHHKDKFKSVQECCCPLNYHPVCGMDGRVYHNYCHLTCNGCHQSPDGGLCGMGGLGPYPLPGPGGFIPKNPNAIGGFIPKNPNAVGGFIPKNPNVDGGFIPKNPNVGGEVFIPKNPNVGGEVFVPKNPNVG